MSLTESIRETIQIVNEMQAEGVIGQYAIGGAVAAAFYVEPASTADLDVFVTLEPLPGRLLAVMDPIYEYLRRVGHYEMRGEHAYICGWEVQFLPSEEPLMKEALTEAVEKDLDGVKVRVFRAEHLAAIALKLRRAKDKLRLAQFVESGVLDRSRFRSIIERHHLTERWEAFKRQVLD